MVDDPTTKAMEDIAAALRELPVLRQRIADYEQHRATPLPFWKPPAAPTIGSAHTLTTKPWGYEILWTHVTGKYAGKFLFIHAGESLSMQYHVTKHETFIVMDGKVELEQGKTGSTGTNQVMKRGCKAEIPPYRIHRLTALENSVLVEVSTSEIDDVVRIEDRYGREGTRGATPVADATRQPLTSSEYDAVFKAISIIGTTDRDLCDDLRKLMARGVAP